MALLWCCALPATSACVWLATLMGMLISWHVEGSPWYSSMADSQTIAYISDIGAQRLKPLFVAGSILTTLLLTATLFSERWFRHRHLLVPNQGRAGKSMSISSLVFACCGAAGLVFLSIFDTTRHSMAHNIFLMIFIVGYLGSAICYCVSYQRLWKYNPGAPSLRWSFYIKLVFIVAEATLAIAFVSLMHSAWRDVAAVLEWLIAFLFSLYILSFIYDLLPLIDIESGAARDVYPLDVPISPNSRNSLHRTLDDNLRVLQNRKSADHIYSLAIRGDF